MFRITYIVNDSIIKNISLEDCNYYPNPKKLTTAEHSCYKPISHLIASAIHLNILLPTPLTITF